MRSRNTNATDSQLSRAVFLSSVHGKEVEGRIVCSLASEIAILPHPIMKSSSERSLPSCQPASFNILSQGEVGSSMIGGNGTLFGEPLEYTFTTRSCNIGLILKKDQSAPTISEKPRLPVTLTLLHTRCIQNAVPPRLQPSTHPLWPLSSVQPTPLCIPGDNRGPSIHVSLSRDT